jgi:hypothetical protein
VQISGGKFEEGSGHLLHYALSCRDGRMSEETARVLAQLILQLKRANGDSRLFKGDQDVFHLLIYPAYAKPNLPIGNELAAARAFPYSLLPPDGSANNN